MRHADGKIFVVQPHHIVGIAQHDGIHRRIKTGEQIRPVLRHSDIHRLRRELGNAPERAAAAKVGDGDAVKRPVLKGTQ